jgi:hypothetical protein
MLDYNARLRQPENTRVVLEADRAGFLALLHRALR